MPRLVPAFTLSISTFSQHPVHVFRHPEVSLEQLHVHALYVVPAERMTALTDGWQGKLIALMQSCAEFHTRSFFGR